MEEIIKGTINIGFDLRVSDLFANPSKSFVPVFDIVGAGSSVVIVNKAHVVTVEPEHEADEFVERHLLDGQLQIR